MSHLKDMGRKVQGIHKKRKTDDTGLQRSLRKVKWRAGFKIMSQCWRRKVQTWCGADQSTRSSANKQLLPAYTTMSTRIKASPTWQDSIGKHIVVRARTAFYQFLHTGKTACWWVEPFCFHRVQHVCLTLNLQSQQTSQAQTAELNPGQEPQRELAFQTMSTPKTEK